jgi:hypothetical protein
MSMLIELLANTFVIVFVIVATYGHALLFKALLPNTWSRRRPVMGRWRHRAAVTQVRITGEAYDVRP